MDIFWKKSCYRSRWKLRYILFTHNLGVNPVRRNSLFLISLLHPWWYMSEFIYRSLFDSITKFFREPHGGFVSNLKSHFFTQRTEYGYIILLCLKTQIIHSNHCLIRDFCLFHLHSLITCVLLFKKNALVWPLQKQIQIYRVSSYTFFCY